MAIERPELRFPASCDAYACEVCGSRKAQQVAAIMTWAARQADRRRLVTLTALPVVDGGRLDWQGARRQVRQWVAEVRRDGYAWEWAWAVERNPRGTGFHAHGLQHGAYVPQALLQERWGGRLVDVRALKQPAAGVYAVKEALRVAGYVTKGAGDGDDQALGEHLRRNGGRAAHWSRGFLHGHTKRGALAQLRNELADGQDLTWVLVQPGQQPPAALPSRDAGEVVVDLTGGWAGGRPQAERAGAPPARP